MSVCEEVINGAIYKNIGRVMTIREPNLVETRFLVMPTDRRLTKFLTMT